MNGLLFGIDCCEMLYLSCVICGLGMFFVVVRLISVWMFFVD